jgi:hypothetical protein
MSAQLFSALLALGREEHALVTDGRWEDLADLNARRERVLAALPASAPADALADLREAARLQALSAAILRQGIAETGGELRRLGSSRTAVAGYAATTQPAGWGPGPSPRGAYDHVG